MQPRTGEARAGTGVKTVVAGRIHFASFDAAFAERGGGFL